MGCDIHCYLEYRDPNPEWKPQDGIVTWSGWPRINPGRNYEVFGHLAGVRSGVDPVVEPRGIPEDISWETAGDYWMYVNDERLEGKRTTTTEKALEWAKYGCKLVHKEDGTIQKVSHPDWHTHSWITTDEFAQVLGRMSPSRVSVEYWALLAAMKELEWHGQEVRLVFWFDN